MPAVVRIVAYDANALLRRPRVLEDLVESLGAGSFGGFTQRRLMSVVDEDALHVACVDQGFQRRYERLNDQLEEIKKVEKQIVAFDPKAVNLPPSEAADQEGEATNEDAADAPTDDMPEPPNGFDASEPKVNVKGLWPPKEAKKIEAAQARQQASSLKNVKRKRRPKGKPSGGEKKSPADGINEAATLDDEAGEEAPAEPVGEATEGEGEGTTAVAPSSTSKPRGKKRRRKIKKRPPKGKGGKLSQNPEAAQGLSSGKPSQELPPRDEATPKQPRPFGKNSQAMPPGPNFGGED